MAKSFSVIIIQMLSTKLQQLPSAGQHMWQSLAPGPWPYSKVLKNRSLIFMSRVKILSRSPQSKISTDNIQQQKTYREWRYIKACMSVQLLGNTCLVPHKIAEEGRSVSAPCWNWTYITQLTATILESKAV